MESESGSECEGCELILRRSDCRPGRGHLRQGSRCPETIGYTLGPHVRGNERHEAERPRAELLPELGPRRLR